jgi:hypothetical protein
MKHMALQSLLAFWVASCPSPSAIIISTDSNPPVDVDGVASRVTGSGMAGVIVTATYWSPSSPGCPGYPFALFCPLTLTAIWTSAGGDGGMAADYTFFPYEQPSWSLAVTGDTSEDFIWAFRGGLLSPLLSLEIDGSAAGIFFDRANPDPGTAGSSSGNDLEIRWVPPNAVPAGDVFVTYAGAVRVGGGTSAGDLFSRVSIDFSRLEYGGVPAQNFDLTLDSDSVVPEPQTGLLALLGLAVIASRKAAGQVPGAGNPYRG